MEMNMGKFSEKLVELLELAVSHTFWEFLNHIFLGWKKES